MKPEQSIEGQPSIAKAALFGLCPQCGSKTLFAGLGQFADTCANCHLDFSSYNVGDGPAALLTMGIGTLIIILALVVDSVFRPPFWVHVLIWVPITAALTVITLRMAKAALLSAEHRNRAHEAGKSDLL
ncbi:DUF983 domain-containing protein [Sphingorhabdus wooponensis]|jgi:uncharacterized protein (DUF983 family)|uniref:DUF983 domain-containing protein n=1 Tax=Sphingorhabdus wooponensis TaxID=940136 RepID=A0A3R8R3M3_9SPHN|nr:DUF983 domain-containing protein [Sphingorhabdus wooponensis]RRQ51177.1 DUF983 domain-containing protein [Sphingorhabdus wooponensis]